MTEPSGLSLLSRLPDEVISAIFLRLKPEEIVKMANVDPKELGGLANKVLTSFSQEIAYASANNLRVYNELREKISRDGTPLSCLEILQRQIEDLHAQAIKLNLVVWMPREAWPQNLRQLLSRIVAEEEHPSFKGFVGEILKDLNKTASPKIVLPAEEFLTRENYRRRCWDVLRPHLGSISSLCTSGAFTRLPPEIKDLTNLRILTLSKCQLVKLPTEIGASTALQELNLSDNHLRALPAAISALRALKELNLGNNQLTAVPDAISALTALERFDFDQNRLTAVPDAISALTRLTWIDLRENQLTAVPDAISTLTRLTWIDLGDNQLTAVPDAISALTRLTWIDLDKNHLRALPAAISALTALKELNLGNNQLTAIPDAVSALTALKVLDISKNQMNTQPHVIASLPSLRSLAR